METTTFEAWRWRLWEIFLAGRIYREEEREDKFAKIKNKKLELRNLQVAILRSRTWDARPLISGVKIGGGDESDKDRLSDGEFLYRTSLSKRGEDNVSSMLG